MITEQELKAAIFAVERDIAEAAEHRVREKHDAGRRKELADRIATDKVRLQTLHYAEGIAAMISEKELKQAMASCQAAFAVLTSPHEQDLFRSTDDRGLDRKVLVLKTKFAVLEFIAGLSPKLL